MSKKQSYYERLGIDSNADDATIKKAYKRLAIKYHPDRNQNNPQAEETFKQIKVAYETLSDPQKKRLYDQMGQEHWEQYASGGGQGSTYTQPSASYFFDAVQQMLQGSFGSWGEEEVQQGHDLQIEVLISLEEVLNGVSKRVNVEALRPCGSCQGSGSENNRKPVPCSTCRGSGKRSVREGMYLFQTTCPSCQGQKFKITHPCGYCRGRGVELASQSLELKIPPGAIDGLVITAKGYGNAAPMGGTPGNLCATVRIKKHPIFIREGSALECEVPIDFVTAALGGNVEIPTLTGRGNLKLPRETQTNSLFRIKGKGLPDLRRPNHHGDLLCRVIVETPVKLTAQQEKLLIAFGETLGETQSAKQQPKALNFKDRVKQFFEGLKF